MGKVSYSLCIALLITVVNSFPLEEKPEDKPNGPHVLSADPPTHVHDNKPRKSTSETNRPKRNEPEQPHKTQPHSDEHGQNEHQGPTPKPVHHYRDGPIIQRRNADDKPRKEGDSQEERHGSHETKHPETRHRRDTKDESEKDGQSALERSNPSVLAANPNTQSHAYLPTSSKTSTTDSEEQKVHDSRSSPALQYGASTSPRVPDLIPASSTHLRATGQSQDRNAENQQHPLEAPNSQNGESTVKVTGDHQQERKTRDLPHVHDEDKKTKPGQESQQRKPAGSAIESNNSPNRKSRDVTDNQPHLLASNPKSSLNNKDDSSSLTRSPVAGVSSSTTENTRFSNVHTQKVE